MHIRIIGLLSLAALACGGSNMTGTGGGGGNQQGSGNSVSIVDDAYSPGTITITAGTQVTWMNNGATNHTATADDNSWTSGTLASATGGGAYGGGSAGQSFSHTFATPGTYTYHCGFHASMHGTIQVN